MRHPLLIHPASTGKAFARLEVDVVRDADWLHLRYHLLGDLSALSLPPRTQPRRRRGLWDHTCFEAFIGEESDYLELNFAPSGEWGAFRFQGYRNGGWDAAIEEPCIALRERDGLLEFSAGARISRWEGRLGLSAVLEEKAGAKSFWALVHPREEPDFHHPDCFALPLPARGGP